MVIDTSAIMTILRWEPEARLYLEAISRDPSRLMSAGSYLETSMVALSRAGEAGARDLDLLLHRAGIELRSFTNLQAEIARDAFWLYGKGRHPAGLNFGDCMAYALAKETGEPLLFKGEDFRRTDVRTVSLV